jgi:large subunit ribosomal protein L17
MRHGKKFNHLGRKSAHRKAMLRNMANSLIEHKKITTTVAKAKALRQYIEPLITKSKENTTHSRRVVFSYLQNKEAVKELFGEIASKVYDRPGGYTRILKIGNRKGDNAEMAFIELVDFSEFDAAGGSSGASTKRKKRRRRGKSSGSGSSKKEKEQTPVVEDVIEDAEEVVEEVVEKVEDTVEEVAEKVEESVEEAVETVEEVVEEATEDDEEKDKKED